MEKLATKNIFVTGGVLSGLGKGVAAASLGRLLKARGYKVFVQKFDPYYNVDPGTMSPYQHGEVYVTDDGTETDLDLGHYERFIDEKFTKDSNYTQGKILFELLQEERDGVYGGNTVQVIPHLMNKIIEKIKIASDETDADFVITEIGGTTGDIESTPFIAAISDFKRRNPENTFFIHVTYIPYLESSDEFKSKPTQHSVSQLKSMGVFPNMILLRSNKKVTKEMVDKVAKATYTPDGNVLAVPNVDNIYKVPLLFEKNRLASKVLRYFGLPNGNADLENWKEFIDKIDKKNSVTLEIGMVGKYVEYLDAYKSIIEALKISASWNDVNIKFDWIQSSDITNTNVQSLLENKDGVVILPGFGKRGFDGKVITAKYTRDNNIPTFGICYGFQAMVVDQAIRKDIVDATSSEISDSGTFVIDIITGKKKSGSMGGTLRLGSSKTIIKDDTLASVLYNANHAFERHRHRYEANPEYIEKIEDDDFIFSGFDEEKGYAEVCELKNHKFYLGLQAHPEFNANPLREHPLFKGFIQAVITDKGNKNDR